MSRRTYFRADDLAFPIRLKFVVPWGPLQWANDARDWLDTELGPNRWAWSEVRSSACVRARAYYFRSLADAQRFMDAFPQLKLADGVDARGRGSRRGSYDAGLTEFARVGVGPRGSLV